MKTLCSRLKNENVLHKEPTGYVLIKVAAQAARHDLEMLQKYEEGARPLLHDIHLIFKREIFKQAEHGNKTIPPLSIPCLDERQRKILDSTFGVVTANPLDPYCFYQIWPREKTENISGGFQEVFRFQDYSMTIQLWGTGTMKICTSNSETPFDLAGFRNFLHDLNGVFLARTGLPFEAVHHLFYFEHLEINHDQATESLEGLSNRNFTVQFMDNWMLRVYEKRIGEKQLIRQEKVLVDGNYIDHSLNTMMAVIEGGFNPTILTANDFAQMKRTEQILEVLMENQKTLKAHDRILEGIVKHLNGGTL